MTTGDLLDNTAARRTILDVKPTFIWPDNRIHDGSALYAEIPPGRGLFADADLVSGVIVGAGDATVEWIEKLLASAGRRQVSLVLVVFPAGPTRAEHLKRIQVACARWDGGSVAVDVRLLPMANTVDGDCERVVLPPTVIQALNTDTGRTVMSVGSVGDLGQDPMCLGSLNVVLQPDYELRDAWRRWFQYLFSASTPLTLKTSEIPHLVPAKGEPEAAMLWDAFMVTCAGESDQHTAPTVDPMTGEVTAEPNGKKTVPWDGGKTALEPLALVFQQLYAAGYLVTVDEVTRIKPLTIPVNATLLGQQSERTVGAVKQRQSFTLQVLDDSVNKAIEKCRKVTDVMELLTYSLSQGNRWLPDAAKALLEKELAARNEQGQRILWEALGGNGIGPEAAKTVIEDRLKAGSEAITDALRKAVGKQDLTTDAAERIVQEMLMSGGDEIKTELRARLGVEYVKLLIERKTESIRQDLNKMYRELGQGDTVPADKLRTVLRDVEDRLITALNQRITPRAVYNRIGTPDLTASATDENWNQPLSLLTRSARILRELHTDPFFPRRFTGLSFSQEEFSQALDVFGDVMVAKPQSGRAKKELEKIEEITETRNSAKQKCKDLWQMIQGLGS